MSLSNAPINHPFWWDDAGLQQASIALPFSDFPDTIETLVVGAGYSGLSAALTLAKAGRDVVVIDAKSIGYGCSSRNGGQIGPSFHKLGVKGLTTAFGEKTAHNILHESMKSLDFLQSRIQNEGIECDLQSEIGRFKGASRAHHYGETARANEDLAKAVGLEFEMIPKEKKSAGIGSNFYHGGAIYPQDGLLQPAKYVLGLAGRCAQEGVKIFAPAPVHAIRRDGNTFTAHIENRTITAKQILIATNGYSGPELPFYHHRIMPLRSAIIATQPLDKALVASLFPNGRPVVDTSRLVLYYRPSPDGTRIIFGGRAFDLSDRPDKYAPDLHRLMTRIFPALQNVEISHAWSGTVAYTFDHSPHIGQNDGLFYTMGYCGSGVGRATYYGHKAALKMLGHKGGKTALDGLEFPNKALYSGTPWFLPAVLRWNSFMDRLGR